MCVWHRKVWIAALVVALSVMCAAVAGCGGETQTQGEVTEQDDDAKNASDADTTAKRNVDSGVSEARDDQPKTGDDGSADTADAGQSLQEGEEPTQQAREGTGSDPGQTEEVIDYDELEGHLIYATQDYDIQLILDNMGEWDTD